MTWTQEAVQSIGASWRLLMHDTDAYRAFNETIDGFWRSFAAFFIVAPVYLLATSLVPVERSGDSSDPSIIIVTVSLGVQWLAWPLLMAGIAYALKIGAFYVRYVIAYNWSSILVAALQLMPLAFLPTGIISLDLAQNLSFFIFLGLLYFRWYIAVTALEVPGLIGFVLVLADLVSGIAISRAFNLIS